MSDDSSTTPETSTPAPLPPRPRRAASRPAGPAAPVETPTADSTASAAATPSEKPSDKPAAAKKTAAKRTSKKAAAAEAAPVASDAPADAPAKRSRKKAASSAAVGAASVDSTSDAEAAVAVAKAKRSSRKAAGAAVADEAAEAVTPTPIGGPVLFQAPEPVAAPSRRTRAKAPVVADDAAEAADVAESADPSEASATEGEEGDAARRRRRRGGRRRRKGGADNASEPTSESADDAEGESDDNGPEDTADNGDEESTSTRRRRRRRRRGGAGDDDASTDDPPNTVVRVRAPRDDVTAVRGSTRLEAKKQRRRDGREAGRRRAPILSEAEFLARREDVDRVMVVREKDDRIQIAVLEDGILVEHYVDRGSSGSMVGNVYLGRVQNVLPSMEAAFVDIGRGRNAVLYAGEVNWDAAGLDGQPKRIEFALKSGDPVLVQVTKDPLGHKGARLTSQISLPGRYLVYVPDNSMTGISRKLPDTERGRLKRILRDVVPADAGVIVRTAAEGASEAELERDVARLSAQWEDIKLKSQTATPPTLLYGEPDLAIRVVRDIFNEDFNKLVVSGPGAWETLEQYVTYVAPDLSERLEKWVSKDDVFSEYRVDEQLTKAFDRKVWLPSGGSLVIDRTEAMTVVDVNTGKFTGQGGNLEETVTKNNLEAAEEIVRQLRLRDIGGIIVVDFIDMVLESNRDSVIRRLVECLGRDRTKHQVAEITSLGLVQMTRKRIGQGLLETFSEPCEHCNGRGVRVQLDPITPKTDDDRPERGSRGGGGGKGKASRGAGKADPVSAVRASRSRKGSGSTDVAEVVEVVEVVEVPSDEITV